MEYTITIPSQMEGFVQHNFREVESFSSRTLCLMEGEIENHDQRMKCPHCKCMQIKNDRKYTLDQVEDCISTVRYYVPKGRSFSECQWIDSTEEQQVLLYRMGIEEMGKLYPGLKVKAENECLRWQCLLPKRGRKKKS